MEPEVIVAAAVAAVPGVAALVVAVVLGVRLRRLRSAQSVLMPDGEAVPVVERQAALGEELAALRGGLDDLRALVDAQARHTAAELAKSLRFQGLVRYDAYGDMGGRQSWSIALLDESANGTVISCLHARDHARVYLKEVAGGGSAQRLSPEEVRAIGMATGTEPTQQAAA